MTENEWNEVDTIQDAVQDGDRREFVLTPGGLKELFDRGVPLFVEQLISPKELVSVAEAAPVGNVGGCVECGELIAERLYWDNEERINLLAGQLDAPAPLIDRVARCRARITSPEEDVLWNQCYRVAAELLADLSTCPFVSNPRLYRGVYRTVDGDVLHVWVECEYDGETYVCETHTHKPNDVTGNRGGMRVVPDRPDEYEPVDDPYTPDEIVSGCGPTGDPRVDRIEGIFRGAVERLV